MSGLIPRRLYERGLPSVVTVDVDIVSAVLPDPKTGKVRRVVPLVREHVS